MSQKKVIENYGDIHLHPGYYPMAEEYDLGGCFDGNKGGCLEMPSAQERARVAERKLIMEQRGMNNPLKYVEAPLYTHYATGTGCMNRTCQCKDCSGLCSCPKTGCAAQINAHKPVAHVSGGYLGGGVHMGGMSMNTDEVVYWAGMIALGWFLIKWLRK